MRKDMARWNMEKVTFKTRDERRNVMKLKRGDEIAKLETY